jgi:hypothetical protein
MIRPGVIAHVGLRKGGIKPSGPVPATATKYWNDIHCIRIVYCIVYTPSRSAPGPEFIASKSRLVLRSHPSLADQDCSSCFVSCQLCITNERTTKAPPSLSTPDFDDTKDNLKVVLQPQVLISRAMYRTNLRIMHRIDRRPTELLRNVVLCWGERSHDTHP